MIKDKKISTMKSRMLKDETSQQKTDHSSDPDAPPCERRRDAPAGGVSRREFVQWMGLAAAGMAASPLAFTAEAFALEPGQAPKSLEGTDLAKSEWPSYAGDKASSKYSPLDQIDAGNFGQLDVAWTWRSPDEAITEAHPDLSTWVWETTPLMIDGVLYLSTSMCQVAALDAATGETLWVYDPETWKNGIPSNNGFAHRGVAYWADGDDRRILYGTADGYLIALNAETGEPIPGFGQNGRVDLTEGLGRPVDRDLYGVNSPPIITRDVVVVGSRVEDVPLDAKMPPGDVRGFDVRTGEQRWIFHSIPEEGEFGNETWGGQSWKNTGGANVWTMMSVDEELGYVYLPFGTPANDYYGGDRPGDGLFGESLVCLDARTGERIWHFQVVHHGLWDYDLPAAPNLFDIRVDGEPVKAVGQVSKQGFLYVFDRVTGEPIWPIEERPVPQSTVPGEVSSATQPFPTKPAPFDRQGLTEDDVIDFTPELREQALAVLEEYNYGPLYTPPSLEKPTIQMPGIAGGASWSGAAFDPETGTAYVSSVTLPYEVTLLESPVDLVDYFGGKRAPVKIQDMPISKPPYGRITAIDMNTGEHRWMEPLGDLAQSNPVLQQLDLPPLGRPARGHMLLTETLLIVGQEGTTTRGVSDQGESDDQEGPTAGLSFEVIDPTLVAFDKATGEAVGEVPLPRNATGAPMTYKVDGKQYIIVATGGANLPAELVALSLP